MCICILGAPIMHACYACMLCKLDRGRGRDIEREMGRDREMEGEKEKAR